MTVARQFVGRRLAGWLPAFLLDRLPRAADNRRVCRSGILPSRRPATTLAWRTPPPGVLACRPTSAASVEGNPMSKPQLGKLEPVDIRVVWKHEERDFTPWLADNIDQLSELLGVPITVDQTEHKVGGYELDILGHVEESDAVVIVENQLDATNHSHLGQLITYAAGLEAAIVIWVAPQVHDEHRAAIEWLNSRTDDKVSFFLVRPEVLRIDNSNPAIRFQLEASPSEFRRRLGKVVAEEDTPRHEFRRKFWEGLLQYLAGNGHPWAAGRSTTKEAWIASAVGKGGVGANVSMAQGSRMRVEIYCSNDPDKQLFQSLFAHKDEIEQRFPGEVVSWERLDDAAASRVAVYRPYDKEQAAEDTPYRKELYAWTAKNLSTFRAVAKQYLVDKQPAESGVTGDGAPLGASDGTE
jgi:hypothetical protein